MASVAFPASLKEIGGHAFEDCVALTEVDLSKTALQEISSDAFRETGLNDYLVANGINDLVICGMMTHMCVDATVRAAKDMGYDCTVIKDACATKSLQIKSRTVAAEEVQTAFLAALNYYYSVVISTESYLKGLKET